MIGALGVSLLITVAVIGGVAALVRWAIREGEGNDPRWGLYGRLDQESPLASFATRAFAIPQSNALVLRGSRAREAAWERSYIWTRVSMHSSTATIVLTGPFGQLTCPIPPDVPLADVIQRFSPAAAGHTQDEGTG
jgi:hypothetical protein